MGMTNGYCGSLSTTKEIKEVKELLNNKIDKEWTLINDIVTTEEVNTIMVTKDLQGNALMYDELLVHLMVMPSAVNDELTNLHLAGLTNVTTRNVIWCPNNGYRKSTDAVTYLASKIYGKPLLHAETSYQSYSSYSGAAGLKVLDSGGEITSLRIYSPNTNAVLGVGTRLIAYGR